MLNDNTNEFENDYNPNIPDENNIENQDENKTIDSPQITDDSNEIYAYSREFPKTDYEKPQTQTNYEQTEQSFSPRADNEQVQNTYTPQTNAHVNPPYQSPYMYSTGTQQTPPNGYYYPKQNKPKKEKEKKYAKISVPALAILLAVTVLASALLGVGGGVVAGKITSKNNSSGLTIQSSDNHSSNVTAANTNSSELSVKQIADMTADSVVEIVTEIVQTNSFYQQYITSGAGSGVIISKDGYIITNNHVIENASKITVTLRSGENFNAKLVGTDTELDVALLKITPASELSVAVFGDSSKLSVGDKTVVIGNPLGQLGGTVTDGIISALDRDVTIDGKTMSLMQTNAAINPGNSGGGIFNAQGELIGLVVAKSAGSEIEGLGFAIPINNILDVRDDLMQYGYVRGKVSLGITMVDIDSQQMAMMYNVTNLGCYITSVELNSNASRAGLQSGDRIIAINGNEIAGAQDVVDFIDNASVGDTIDIEVERNGRTGTLNIVLEEDVPDDIGNNDNINNSDSDYSENDDNSQNGSGSRLEDFLNQFGF